MKYVAQSARNIYALLALLAYYVSIITSVDVIDNSCVANAINLYKISIDVTFISLIP